MSSSYAGAVRAASAHWDAIGASPEALSLLRRGLHLQVRLEDLGEPSREGYPLTAAEYLWFEAEADRLTRLGVIVELHEVPKVCAPAFFVPKGAKFRLVADFRNLNEATVGRLDCSLPGLLPWLERHVEFGARVQVADVSDAFYALALSPETSALCNFAVGTGKRRRFFRYLALPMGLSSSPGALTCVFRTIDKHLTRLGLPTQSYLDDFIAAPPRGREGELEALLVRLGLRVKPSSRQLGTSVVYLGHQLLTKSCRLSLTAERRSALSEMIKKWFAYLREHRGCVPLRWVESGVGRLVFASTALPLLRLDLPALYRDVQTPKFRRGVAPEVRISSSGKSALSRIQKRLGAPGRREERDWSPKRPAWEVYTDASETGYGFVVVRRGGASVTPIVVGVPFVRAETSLHINGKEVVAIDKAVEYLIAEGAKDEDIRVWTDSLVAKQALAKGMTMSVELLEPIRSVLCRCRKRGLRLDLCYVPTDSNPADAPSRLQHRETFQFMHAERVLQEVGAVEASVIDLFANAVNRVVPGCRFCSVTSELGSLGDAFAVDWRRLRDWKWLNPPFSLADRVITKIQRERPQRLLLCLPEWTQRSWYPRLAELPIRRSWRFEGVCYKGADLTVLPPPGWATRVLFVDYGGRCS